VVLLALVPAERPPRGSGSEVRSAGVTQRDLVEVLFRAPKPEHSVVKGLSASHNVDADDGG
jgi:hypothetical protein